jgi:hypothetical protein
VNAEQVRQALRKRWPDAEYLTIDEAPEASDRGGRKIDLLAISLWRSRGLEVDAVEIKVSPSDWKRELEQVSKGDFWWRHSHRFWIACPVEMCSKVREDLPAGWGLLACYGAESSKVVVKARRRDAEPIQWGTAVGLMRAAASAGLNALSRAEQRGLALGKERGREEALRQGADASLRRQYEALRERVKQFEDASGLVLSQDYPNPEELDTFVSIVRKEMSDPGWMAKWVGEAAESVVADAHRLLKQAQDTKKKAEAVSVALAAARPSLSPAVADSFVCTPDILL